MRIAAASVAAETRSARRCRDESGRGSSPGALPNPRTVARGRLAPMRAARVQIDDDAAAAVRRGRPWVYREAIRGGAGGAPGSGVDLVDRRGAFVGRGLLDPESPV